MTRQRAILWLVLSILIISGIPWGLFITSTYLASLRMHDPRYAIQTIVQDNSDTDPLKTDFLAELLQLSSDIPTNLYQLDLGLAKQRLESCPLIKTAECKRGHPHSLRISYSMRKPVAKLGRFANTAIDQEGVLFPLQPFFSPKKLPILILGETDLSWGQKIPSDKLALFFDVFKKARLGDEITIDTSYADELSLGEQKIIVIANWEGKTHQILLDPVAYQEGLKRYQRLKLQWEFSGMVDLRLPHLGYLQRM